MRKFYLKFLEAVQFFRSRRSWFLCDSNFPRKKSKWIHKLDPRSSSMILTFWITFSISWFHDISINIYAILSRVNDRERHRKSFVGLAHSIAKRFHRHHEAMVPIVFCFSMLFFSFVRVSFVQNGAFAFYSFLIQIVRFRLFSMHGVCAWASSICSAFR